MHTITNESINGFKLYLYEEEKSENTIDKYIRDVRCLREWLGEDALDKHALLEYKKALCEKYAPRSVNSVLSLIHI